ncbi:MAG: MFS transporter [Chloroflexota bacterium]
MLIGLVVGLVVGLLAGGNLSNLATIRLRSVGLLFVAVILRFGTEAALRAGVPLADQLRLPLFAVSFAILLTGLWANRRFPGISLAFVGILLNATAILVNGGYMPIYLPSLTSAGFTPADVSTQVHTIIGPQLDAQFLLHAGPLADIIPIPVPIIQNVASVGDLFLTAGLAFFLFAGVVRTPREELDEDDLDLIQARLSGLVTTATPTRATGPRTDLRLGGGEAGLGAGLAQTATLERPFVIGAGAARTASPAALPLPLEPTPLDLTTAAGGGDYASILAPPAAPAVDRARRHPYVRLALNGSFSALWAGQLISMFGDRIHQLALAAIVLITTQSIVATALVFVAATLPNLLFAPIAGAYVDRWEHKEVLVVSDLLRAATVLLVPIAAVTNVVLVYPLIFLVTTISIFFRPARIAILPRIVRDDDLFTANSGLWIAETLADVVGYPLAGLFVASLGTALPLAFWLDAATYVASALLIATIVVRPRSAQARHESLEPATDGLRSELKVGWRFLRSDRPLLANTVQATIAQFTVGILVALTPVYAKTLFDGALGFGWEAIYAFLETGIGLGNLIGGFVIGAIGARFAKGRMIIVGYTVWGLCTVGLAVSGHVGAALGFALGSGVANMIFVIPSQTMFQLRTPPDLIGRVVGFRSSLVFGALTIAMAVGGLLAQAIGVTTVIAIFGCTTLVAGLAGLFVPAVRDA